MSKTIPSICANIYIYMYVYTGSYINRDSNRIVQQHKERGGAAKHSKRNETLMPLAWHRYTKTHGTQRGTVHKAAWCTKNHQCVRQMYTAPDMRNSKYGAEQQVITFFLLHRRILLHGGKK